MTVPANISLLDMSGVTFPEEKNRSSKTTSKNTKVVIPGKHSTAVRLRNLIFSL